MMIFKKAIPRRTVLRGAGATLALPFLDCMIPALATAADTASTRALRMGFVYVPNGITMNQWTPQKEGSGFEMTPILQPLAPFKDRLVILSGLDQKPANALPGEGGAFHTRTSSAYLTGVHPKPTEGADIRGGVSVDQIAAKALGNQTQLASLEVSLDHGETAGSCEAQYTCAYLNSISWRTPSTPMPMESNPRDLFERLFGNSDTTDRATRMAQIRDKRSLLDSITQAVKGFLPEVDASDRAKLAEYLDAVRDVERRIQIAEQQASRDVPTLERPAGSIPASFEEYIKIMFDLQVLAYQSDLTRVTTFMVGRELNSRTYSQIGVPEAHHPISHHRGDPTLMAKVAKINVYHAKMFSYFLERLASSPDGDGSLLDHSMICYGSGMSDGNLHSNESLPVALAGGAAGKIKGDRHLRYPSGTPMANLYLTMLDMMGVPVDSLGDSTGKLAPLSIS